MPSSHFLSTDKCNSDNELITVDMPDSVTAEGLLLSLKRGLQVLVYVILVRLHVRLVGVGTDGASTNIVTRGLKGQVQQELDWIFWMWCLAHHLELPVKDALSDSCFDSIDDMLLRLYYIYEK